ncbi:hypothetical protein PACILC2_00890 [Paenibacillus cisolokensis]|uniref:Uncharacterized protein n=1 Tax=Paenibacillus cisolokensis TaxID=1658519 RepID=A0ABQ4N021_9BACL|nr:hypothetical protein PACILC2_00890 [Paenibacillus cisolokensis]
MVSSIIPQRWISVNLDHIETAIGRKLTPTERSFVEWLYGWDKSTKDTFDTLLYESWKNGLNQGRQLRED